MGEVYYIQFGAPVSALKTHPVQAPDHVPAPMDQLEQVIGADLRRYKGPVYLIDCVQADMDLIRSLPERLMPQDINAGDQT